MEVGAGPAAAEHDAEAWYTDRNDRLARDDIDFVHVTTPSSHHHVASIAASKAGKHSFVTKPIDISLENIDAMIDAAEDNDVVLAAVHQFRAYASYSALRQAIAEGRLGEIHYGNAFVPWWREQTYYTDRWQGTWEFDGGGALMNQTVHWVDLLLWMMGDVDNLAGYAATRAHQMETEDIGTVAIQFRSGAHGCLQGTTLTYKGMDTRLEVHGSKGNVIITADRITHWDVDGEPSLAEETVQAETAASDPRAGLGDAVVHEVRLTRLTGPRKRRDGLRVRARARKHPHGGIRVVLVHHRIERAAAADLQRDDGRGHGRGALGPPSPSNLRASLRRKRNALRPSRR